MAKKQGGAKQATAIMNRYKLRLGDKFDKGDTLALDSMNKELAELRAKHEKAKLIEEINNSSPEQLSQLRQAMNSAGQAMQGQGLGQGPQDGSGPNPGQGLGQGQGQGQFEFGGKIGDVPKRQLGTLNNLSLNKETPFVGGLLQGQNVPLAQGRNSLQQEIVYPESLSMEQATQQGSFVPFGDSRRDARKFARQAPRVSNRVGIQRFSGSEEPIAQFAQGGNLPRYAVGGLFGKTIGDSFGSNLPGVSNFQPDNIPLPQQNQLSQGLYEDDPGVQDWMTQPFGSGQQAPLPKGNVNPASMQTNQNFDLNVSNQMFDPNDPYGFNSQSPQLNLPQTPTNLAQDNFNLGSDPANFSDYDDGSGGEDEGEDEKSSYKSRVPWWGAAAQGVGALLANKKGRITAGSIAPEHVDFGREREGFRRNRTLSNSLISRQAASLGSQSGMMGSMITGLTGTQRVLGQQESGSFQGQENRNVGIDNQAQVHNARIARSNQMIEDQNRRGRIDGVFGAITGYGKDLMKSDKYDQMLNMMTPENYEMYAENDSFWRKIGGISPSMDRRFINTKDRVSS